MNKEEAYKLIKGQEVFVRAIFTNIHEDIEIRCITEDADGTEWSVYSDLKNVFTALPTANENATENKPKHDPCRLFKKGDKVRMVEWHGRSFFDGGCHPKCNKWTVTEDETSGVNIEQDGHTITDVPPCYLELVTPVEELEPYYIEQEDFDSLIYNSNGDPDCETLIAFHIKYQDETERKILNVKSYYQSYVYSYEHAKADAEAECDRLNAEWRKEHNND